MAEKKGLHGPGFQTDGMSDNTKAFLRREGVSEEVIREMDKMRSFLAVKILSHEKRPYTAYPSHKAMLIAYRSCGEKIDVLQGMSSWLRGKMDEVKKGNVTNSFLAAVKARLKESPQ
jgi:hypothetical protein